MLYLRRRVRQRLIIPAAWLTRAPASFRRRTVGARVLLRHCSPRSFRGVLRPGVWQSSGRYPARRDSPQQLV